MKKTICLLASFLWTQAAHAYPADGTVQKIGVFGTTWQEPLKLQNSNGDVENSVSNYKGLLLSYERQWRVKGRGWGIGGFVGAGQASGGGTAGTPALDYSGASLPFSIGSVQPRYILAVNEHVDVSLAAAILYRIIEWPESPTVRITTSRSTNAVVSFDIDLNLSEHTSFRQSYGFWALEIGPFWKWGLTYDF